MKKYWKMILNKAKQSAEILIYEQIGAGMFEDGVGAKQFAEDLKALGDVQKITLRLNSPGGSVFEGLAIFNQLEAHPAAKEIIIDGLAASIASVIAMVTGKLIMPANAMLMIHDPWGMTIGNADEMRKMADSLDKVKSSLITAYMKKTGMPEADISDLMSAETWMTAADAKEWGFCDEIIGAVKVAASFDLSKFTNVPSALTHQIDNTAVDSTLRGKAKKEEHPMEKCAKCGTALGSDGQCPACLAQAKARQDENHRISEILAVGQKHGLLDSAMAAVKDGTSIEAFNRSVLDKLAAGHKPTPSGITVENQAAKKPFASFGEFLGAVANAGRPGNRTDPRLFQAAASGASEAVPSDGGFLVQQDFTAALLDKVNETGQLTSRCRRIPLSGNSNGLKAPLVDETSRATGSRWGGVQVYWANESDSATAKKPKFWMLNMSLEKLMGICYATEELLQDSTALESIVTQAFSEEFGFVLDDGILNGTGVGQLLGILNSNALVSISKESGQTAATIAAENVYKMYAAMPARNKANAAWLINSECWPQLMALSLQVGTGGLPIFMPPGGISSSPFGSLLGRPIIEIEQAAALGTVGDICFADLSQYLIIEKDDMKGDASIHVRFIYDEQTFKFTLRTNGMPMWKSSLTPYKGSQAKSPFVALATRS